MTAKRQVATRNGSWIGDQVSFVQIPCEEGQDQVKAPVEHLSNFSKQKKGWWKTKFQTIYGETAK